MTDLSSLIRQASSDKSVISQLNQRVETLRRENLKLRQAAQLDTYYVLYVPKIKKEALKVFLKTFQKRAWSFWCRLHNVWEQFREFVWPPIVADDEYDNAAPLSKHPGDKRNE